MPFDILLIEADPVIRKHLAAVIGRFGYSCCPVAGLVAGLDELARRFYPLVIVDLDLAGASDPGLAQRLRASRPALRLVGLDSQAENHDGDLAVASFDAVVPKPFVCDALLPLIAPILRGGSAAPAAT